jgi:predicted CopG family antitoxin
MVKPIKLDDDVYEKLMDMANHYRASVDDIILLLLEQSGNDGSEE